MLKFNHTLRRQVFDVKHRNAVTDGAHQSKLFSTTYSNVSIFFFYLPVLVTTGVIFAFIGKIGASGSYAVIYTFTAELFPTVIR